MTKSQVIRQKIVDFISDGNRHSVQEMKEYLQKCDIGEYSEGQFAGVIKTGHQAKHSCHEKNIDVARLLTCSIHVRRNMRFMTSFTVNVRL